MGNLLIGIWRDVLGILQQFGARHSPAVGMAHLLFDRQERSNDPACHQGSRVRGPALKMDKQPLHSLRLQVY